MKRLGCIIDVTLENKTWKVDGCDSHVYTKISEAANEGKVFYKKFVRRNFPKLTGKHLCQSLFSNKVAGLRPATLLKKKLWHMCFPLNFAKFSITPPGNCF